MINDVVAEQYRDLPPMARRLLDIALDLVDDRRHRAAMCCLCAAAEFAPGDPIIMGMMAELAKTTDVLGSMQPRGRA